MIFSQIPGIFTPLRTKELFEGFLPQNEPKELIMPDVKRRSVAMFQTLFGVNMSIFMGAMAPGSEVTFFLAGTSVSTLSVTIQSKKFSISVIALFEYSMYICIYFRLWRMISWT